MEKIEQIITIIAVIVLAFLIYGMDYNDKKVEQARELRLNSIEIRLQQHTHYIDDLEADVDNLKEVL